MAVTWALNTWATDSWVGMNGGPPNAWRGASGGSTVQFFTGVSTALGLTYFRGMSRPTVQLSDAGGGTYNVTKTHSVAGDLKPSSVNKETYLIDGELP